MNEGDQGWQGARAHIDLTQPLAAKIVKKRAPTRKKIFVESRNEVRDGRASSGPAEPVGQKMKASTESSMNFQKIKRLDPTDDNEIETIDDGQEVRGNLMITFLLRLISDTDL